MRLHTRQDGSFGAHVRMPEHERRSILNDLDPPFSVALPAEQLAPFVFCSPHSGSIYPQVLLEASRLDAHTLRKSEDCYVDELFAGAVELGAPLISAHFPRAYLDLNREPYELDPQLFGEELPDFANTQSVRVVGGLGTIARIVADSEEIYPVPLTVSAAIARIEHLYKPFHARLTELLERTHQHFGTAILIDCHSMPSANIGHSSSARPDIVLGDRFGASCTARLTRLVRAAFADLGYRVVLNRPYAGGFITEHYGRPAEGVQALQIEINRALYLDERTLRRARGFKSVQADLSRVMARTMAELDWEPVHRSAAE